MAIKPYICGKNSVQLPNSGCGECDELEHRIKKLEDWQEEFVEEGYNALANKPSINGITVEGDKTSEEYLITAIDDETLGLLCDMTCYVPDCVEPIVCRTKVCCAKVACEPTPTCDERTYGTFVWSGTETARLPYA